MILAGCFIMVVVVLAWFSLDRVKEKIQADVRDALQIVLQTTRESLNLWVESNKFQLSRLAGNPRLIALVERQLSVPQNRDAWLQSNALRELRAFIQPRKNHFGQAEFFIISPDFINIASMQDGNMGAKNLIANQALDLLNRSFQGEAVMVPPIWSDIPLITAVDGKNRKTASMFFAAPIKNKKGKIIAVVAKQVDPSKNFTRLIQLGRIGKSGETYAFGRYGKLLSESRFEEDLIKTGLLQEGAKSILKVSVRDPGGDMTRGFTPSVPRYQQPLTLMAREATQGNAGVNMVGYRDYRGVPAYGAWLWDNMLGIGLATEIDVADALGPYYTTRTVILTVLGITVLLALGSLAFAVLIDVRANRALQESYDKLELRVEERTAELRKLSQATENSPASVVVTDKNGTIEYVNPRFSEVTGYSADEAIGQNPSVLKSGDLPQSFYKELWDTILSGKVWRGRFKNKRKNGEEFWESASISPIKNREGEITHFVAVKEDITEQKQLEEALRASEEKSRLLLESVGEGIFGVDLDGRLAFINPAANRMLGYGSDELIGRHVHQKIHHSYEDGTPYPKKKCPMFLTYSTGADHHISDEVLWSKDGTPFHVEYTSMPIKKDGRAVGAVVSFMDITERKKIETALLAEREQLQKILDNSPVGVGISTDDVVRFANPRFIELFDRKVGQTAQEAYVNPEDRKHMLAELERSGIVRDVELQTYGPDGEICDTLATFMRTEYEGHAGVLSWMVDLSGPKKAERELKDRLEELDRFRRMAIGREQKMIELKKEINELLKGIGHAEKYKIH
jgi:PAS domain S-box-containing protein